MEVTFYDRQTTSATSALGELLTERLTCRQRAQIAASIGRVAALYDATSGLGCSIKFDQSRVTVYNGIVGKPAVVLQCSVDELDALGPEPARDGRVSHMIRGIYDGPIRALRARRNRWVTLGAVLAHPVLTGSVLALLSPLTVEAS
ncbi:hypothetical protein [Rhodococcus qingshengii]|uniref:hypothetical protein n=1 Tax=Rhodococcus qingshengii TaxID=334542 RepID=UPI00237C767B|nr:hypothetical protein [Rhodococcus qingshengii]WCT06035.1 hypothetical protein PI247_29910 [Rhodococcus qingshengii]